MGIANVAMVKSTIQVMDDIGVQRPFHVEFYQSRILAHILTKTFQCILMDVLNTQFEKYSSEVMNVHRSFDTDNSDAI